MKRTVLMGLGAAMLLTGYAEESMASYGWASGRIQFFQNQGNFCPTTRNCTGARYLQSQYRTVMPVPDTRVFIRRASDNTVIGQGTTDSNGYFTVYWYDGSTTGNVVANFYWNGEHKNNRFRVQNSAGGTYIFWSNGTFTLRNAQTTQVGWWTWGNSSNPNALANVYEGAWRTWTHSFSASNRMNAYFPNLSIKAFSTTCPTSCARGGSNEVLMDPFSAYSPQARVMHEMGHIASYKSSRDQSYSFCGDYSRNGNGWFMNSDEWQCAGFEEGLATFYGDTVLYTSGAVQPHSCISSNACPTNSFNIETSPGPGGTCATGQNRWPITVTRYLWDAFDTRVDYAGETLSRGIWHFFDTVHAFDNGNDDSDKDEPFACFIWCWVDDQDGRSAVDFRTNWNTWGTNSWNQWNGNCRPVGD